MGRGECSDRNLSDVKLAVIPWHVIQAHRTSESRWIVVNENVYDITKWQKKHPGGAKIMSHFAGQDATDAWTAMHIDKDFVSKFMKPLLVGRVQPEDKIKVESEVIQDFRQLQQDVEAMGLFKTNPFFFIGHLLHIILLEVLAYAIMLHYGTGWIPFLVVAFILMTSQAQAGWTQHDYGHNSVFNSSKLNHLMHYFTIGHLKGASSHWWNFRHYQHHVKPNALGKDPDVNTSYVFVLGEKIARQLGERKRGILPYQWQHHYFWLIGPPILLPVYFHVENLYFVFKRRDWLDMLWMMSFFVRFFYMYGPLLGGATTFGLYMFVRLLESYWFTLVTQMNHIPMEIDRDNEKDWVTSQLRSTCNVDPSPFNDWFTGHLNYQIEHHLFPTMPRHNYIRVMPLVKSLCKKHNLNYISKPLTTACADILRSLHKSGSIWYEAYHYH